jgi:hypothetical protein
MNQRTTTQNQVAPGWQRIDAEGRAQYLPAPTRPARQMPMLGEVLPPANPDTAALVHAWQQPTEAMVEQTSATDRARGVVLRSAPMFGLVALLAIAGALVAYGVAGTVPSVLTFLFMMAGVGGILYWFESRTEYAHSRNGVERLRIVESADIEHARMEHEFNLRRMALEAYIKIMERNHAE